jgi:hypothetical protein
MVAAKKAGVADKLLIPDRSSICSEKREMRMRVSGDQEKAHFGVLIGWFPVLPPTSQDRFLTEQTSEGALRSAFLANSMFILN